MPSSFVVACAEEEALPFASPEGGGLVGGLLDDVFDNEEEESELGSEIDVRCEGRATSTPQPSRAHTCMAAHCP